MAKINEALAVIRESFPSYEEFIRLDRSDNVGRILESVGNCRSFIRRVKWQR